MNNLRLIELAKLIITVAPAAATTGSTTTGSVIDLSNVNKCALMVVTAGTGTITLTITQSTDHAGSNPKNLAFDGADVGPNSTANAFTRSTGLAGTLTIVGSKTVIIDINPDTLDTNAATPFNHLNPVLVLSGSSTLFAAFVQKAPRISSPASEPDALAT